jgi:hypothetical protein
MPSALRRQVALVGVLAVLLIPIGTSSLRGLTHILTCNEQNNTPFSVEVPANGPPSILSSQVIERGANGKAVPNTLCGGLKLELVMQTRQDNRADVILHITNGTKFGWRGSVTLKFDRTTIPVDIGEISAGKTASDSITLHLKRGQSYEIKGRLLIGP